MYFAPVPVLIENLVLLARCVLVVATFIHGLQKHLIDKTAIFVHVEKCFRIRAPLHVVS